MWFLSLRAECGRRGRLKAKSKKLVTLFNTSQAAIF